MGFRVRAGKPDDFEAVVRLLLLAFHDNPDDRELAETDRLVFEAERSLIAIDDTESGEEVVGHTGIFTRDLTVPGAVIPAAFVTMVAVAGTHRRQGVASTLLRQQLADVRATGEPVAVLWASEGRIYQRFGYGLASRRMGLKINTREVQLNAPRAAQSRIRAGAPKDLLADLVPAYEAVRAGRPGFASRSKQWWDFLLADPAARRGGGGPQRAIVHEGPNGPDGYALFRVKQGWHDGGPDGKVMVHHVVAANPAAYRELWRYLLDIDLTRSVSLHFAAIDEPLFDMVNEPRQLGATVGDGLWLRIVDVPAALSARRYAAPIDLVLDISDDLFPQNTGRFRLTGLTGGAHCVLSTDPADLSLDVGTLGALYLGGGTAGALADAGRINELRPGAVAEAHAAFTWHRAPAGIEMF
ncbi:MAG TPA: GNAT family N-acetyltransferase [Micromonosporaceae bacterium]|nr:GNAT family N-acetyltransferase [Micromonosporaceae bacterium]